MASDFATLPTTLATYDDVSYAAIISDQVKDALMAVVVTPALLDFYDLAGSASKTISIPKADKEAAAALTEGTEVANTALSDTAVTGTAAEIGIMATITDVLEVSDIPAAHAARLKQLGRALGDKLDVDICALFSGFSVTVGSSGNNITLANLLDGIYAVEVANTGGLGDLVSVLHPRQVADLRSELEADAASIYVGKSDASISKSMAGYFGSWFGIDIFQSTNVVDDATNWVGALFVRNYALGMVQKWAARVEAMRWPPIRGFVLVATAMYGVFEIEDLAGVDVTTDNSD
jgi:hypothetical protein